MTAILFDLDGTLVDSADGILGSLRTALAELGVPEPASGLGRELLGPPMYVTLPPLLGTAAAEAVIPVYRRVYAETGWLQSAPYEGIDPLLRALAAQGVPLTVATSKQEAAAMMIVEKQGWSELISDVCGDTPSAGRPTKAVVIAAALARRGKGPAVMVGDRKYDVIGARQNGLACFGAGWGYAEPGELLEAGAAAVYATPEALLPALCPPAIQNAHRAAR
ncbi:HAD hydrolase-like protein [Actinoplanes solisilvae]|uniref:HAD hydrolase-like protein n=1 Tax=Actinoplanes solisilvae TaxID=2486853 RepID=UPI000FD7D234|nr:HAD hydrolase-like protein [Actinoplanes solisilvae]